MHQNRNSLLSREQFAEDKCRYHDHNEPKEPEPYKVPLVYEGHEEEEAETDNNGDDDHEDDARDPPVSEIREELDSDVPNAAESVVKVEFGA